MLDIFLYIKLYSESMPYSGIFSTVGIFRQFQAHDSGIIQEQFTHILNITQADSGIEIWLIQAGIVSPIFRYIHKVTHTEAIFAHIRAHFRKFRHIQDPGITGSNNVNEYLLFKSGTSNHCSELFETFFHFCFKSAFFRIVFQR